MRKIPALVFLAVFILAAGLEAEEVSVSDLLNWDLLTDEQRDSLSAAEGRGQLLDILVQTQTLNPLYSAHLLSVLFTREVGETLPRFLLSGRDRAESIEIAINASRILLLENRVDGALHLATQTRVLTGESELLLWVAELEYRNGLNEAARQSLSDFLRANANLESDDYYRAMYLLGLLLIDDGQLDEARRLLTARIDPADFDSDPSYYMILAARLLILTLRTGDFDDPAVETRIRRLEDLTGAPEEEGRMSSPFPDLRILEGSGGMAELERNAYQMLQTEEIGLDGTVTTIQKSGTDAPVPGDNSSGQTVAEGEAQRENTRGESSEAGIIQLGSFSRRGNAGSFIERIQRELGLPVFMFPENPAPGSDDSTIAFKVLLDSGDSYFLSSENYNNPRRLLLFLKEQGIEGFLVTDPRGE